METLATMILAGWRLTTGAGCVGRRLCAEPGEGRSNRHEPQRERGDQVEVEPQHNEIECTMYGAMQYAKSHENPAGIYIQHIHLFGDK